MQHITARVFLGIGLIATISACTNTEDPQLAMCQSVTKQLSGDNVASWDSIEQSDAGKLRTISIAYGGADDSKGVTDCTFPIDADGIVDTAPNAVVFNGEPVGTKALLTAGVKASAELLKGTAANTVARSKELAAEASVAAGELADKASDAASDIAGKAKESAIDATKSLQQKLEQ